MSVYAAYIMRLSPSFTHRETRESSLSLSGFTVEQILGKAACSEGDIFLISLRSVPLPNIIQKSSISGAQSCVVTRSTSRRSVLVLYCHLEIT